MHQDNPESIPDSETGLRIVRWNLRGFLELRRRGLLSRTGEYELVDGLILHRDGGSNRHEAIVKELANRLRADCDSPLVSVKRDFELLFEDQEAAVTPDLVVLRERDGLPQLVIEVSEQTSRVDGMEKEHIYARAGVEEYWLLDLPWSLMYVHTSPDHDGYGLRSMTPKGSVAMTHVALEGTLVFEDLLAAAGAA
jgi:Putative restriction endonuclease